MPKASNSRLVRKSMLTVACIFDVNTHTHTNTLVGCASVFHVQKKISWVFSHTRTRKRASTHSGTKRHPCMHIFRNTFLKSQHQHLVDKNNFGPRLAHDFVINLKKFKEKMFPLNTVTDILYFSQLSMILIIAYINFLEII